MNDVFHTSKHLPSVLVLLPTFNGARWIRSQMESLARQNGVRLAILHADDGSSDGTPSLVQRLADELAIPLLAHRGQPTGSAARNYARLLGIAALEEYDFVAFADQDDVWHADKLRHAIDRMRETRASCYASDLWATFPDGSKVRVKKAFQQRRYDHFFESASAACTYVISSAAAMDVSSRIAGDWTAWSNNISFDCIVYGVSRHLGHTWFIDAEPGIDYRQHEENVFGANIGAHAALVRLNLVRAGWLSHNPRLICRYLRDDHFAQQLELRLRQKTLASRLWLGARAYRFRREPKKATALLLFFLLGWY